VRALRGMDFRPGDWLCTCGAHNYASKSACFKCKMPRDASTSQQPGFHQPQQQQQSYQSQNYNSFSAGGLPGLGGLGGYGNGMSGFGIQEPEQQDFRQFQQQMGFGDYRDGFDFRGGGGIPAVSQNPLQGLGFDPSILFPSVGLPANFRPGDWLCACGNHNYAIRTACGKCGKVKPGAVGGNLPGNFRPGDWMCKCGNHNYQSRTVCGKCQDSKDNAKTSLQVTTPLAANFQVGDWMCTCGAHNYQSKTVCFKCNLPKESAQAEMPATQSGFRPGDWVCDACKNHNYASRIVCGRCKTPKPSDARDRSPISMGRQRSRSPKR